MDLERSRRERFDMNGSEVRFGQIITLMLCEDIRFHNSPRTTQSESASDVQCSKPKPSASLSSWKSHRKISIPSHLTSSTKSLISNIGAITEG